MGNVMSVKSGKLLKPGIGTTGYYLVILCKDGVKKTCKVHRLVAAAFLPNPDGLPFVNHIDHNRLNNNKKNLEWCSPSGNMKHCFNSGRGVIPKQVGEKNVKAKLTADQVREIRATHALGGKTFQDISVDYGVRMCTIARIVNRKLWNHVI